MFQVSIRRSLPSFRNCNFRCTLRSYLSKPEGSLCATVATNNGTKHSRSWTIRAVTGGPPTGGKPKHGDISCFGNNADWFQDPFLSNLLKSLKEPSISLGRQLGKKAAFQCPTNLLYCSHVRWEHLSLSTARALSRSFVASLVLDGKNSGHPSSWRYMWHWEKFSKKPNAERNILFISYACQLWYALIMINN